MPKRASSVNGPGAATFIDGHILKLHATLDRVVGRWESQYLWEVKWLYVGRCRLGCRRSLILDQASCVHSVQYEVAVC